MSGQMNNMMSNRNSTTKTDRIKCNMNMHIEVWLDNNTYRIRYCCEQNQQISYTYHWSKCIFTRLSIALSGTSAQKFVEQQFKPAFIFFPPKRRRTIVKRIIYLTLRAPAMDIIYFSGRFKIALRVVPIMLGWEVGGALILPHTHTHTHSNTHPANICWSRRRATRSGIASELDALAFVGGRLSVRAQIRTRLVP